MWRTGAGAGRAGSGGAAYPATSARRLARVPRPWRRSTPQTPLALIRSAPHLGRASSAAIR